MHPFSPGGPGSILFKYVEPLGSTKLYLMNKKSHCRPLVDELAFLSASSWWSIKLNLITIEIVTFYNWICEETELITLQSPQNKALSTGNVVTFLVYFTKYYYIL